MPINLPAAGKFKFQLILTRDLGVKGVTALEENKLATLSIDTSVNPNFWMRRISGSVLGQERKREGSPHYSRLVLTFTICIYEVVISKARKLLKLQSSM